MNTTNQIIEILNPSEILVNSTNYIQCIINDVFCEFQICYKTKKWYQFKSYGNAMNPKEKFIKYID